MDQSKIESLPTPPGAPGPFERVVATCRPGETDVTVRCLTTGASVDYVLLADRTVLGAHDEPQPDAPEDLGLRT